MEEKRILSIELSNIKNVEYGKIDFFKNFKKISEDQDSVITGIYGQNGSGKTTIVDCFEFLKILAMDRSYIYTNKEGKRVMAAFDYLLMIGKEIGSITFDFLIPYNNNKYKLEYKVDICRDNGFSKLSKESFTCFLINGESSKSYKPLSYDFLNPTITSIYDGKFERKKEKVDKTISKSDIDDKILLESQLLSSIENGKSMIFSQRNIDFLLGRKEEKVNLIGKLIKELKKQLIYNLFTYDKSNEAYTEFGCGPLYSIYSNDQTEIYGIFSYSDEPFYVKTSDLEIYDKAKQEIEIVLSAFVSNFKLKLEKLGTKEESGTEYTKILFLRDFNGQTLPLSEESSGIKKLFSLCCALVFAYGNDDCWLVIDEFDSGVFENLLGQIVKTFEKFGKGQLIFTAHNLAPLERIKPTSIIFTTNNPLNRFTSIDNVRPSNNLRTLYLRALKLGGTDEVLSSDVDVDIIDAAFYRAYKLMKKL